MLKKTISYLSFSIVASVINFVTVIYMARIITPEEMGIVGLFMAVLYITPQLVGFSSVGLISINKVKLRRKEFLDFSKAYISFSFLNFIILLLISIILSYFFQDYWKIFLILPILSFLMFLTSFHQTELVQDGDSKSYGIYNIFNAISTALLTLFFLSGLSLDWNGRLLALMIGQILLVVVMYKKTFITLKLFKISIDKMQFKEFVFFGFPLLLGLGAGWLLNQSDNYIVLYFFTLKDVGIYTVAYSIGTIVNTINQAATNAIVPKLYKALEKKEGYKIVNKLNLYYSIVIITISLTIGAGSYWYMPVIFGDNYSQSADIVFFIALALGFNGIYRTTGGVIAFYKKNQLQMQLIYIGAFTNIIVSIFLIPYFGIVSPAIGTLVAFILLAYLSYVYSWKILKKEELF